MIAAASLSRLSPSTSRQSRAGAPTSRKIPTTAPVSVVATIDASSRHATSDTLGDRRHRQSDRGRRDEHRDDRQQQNRRDIVDHPFHVDRQRRLEEERRHEHEHERLGRDRHVDERARDVAATPVVAVAQGEHGRAADGHAHHGEENRRRERDARRQALQEADDHQQAGDDEKNDRQTHRPDGTLTSNLRIQSSKFESSKLSSVSVP